MEQQNKIYKRKLLVHERRYLLAPNSIFGVIFRIKGDVDENELRSAVLKAQKRHVLLQTKVFLDEKNTAWFTNKDTKEIPVEIIKRKNDKHWVEVYEKEIRKPFDYVNMPAVKFILLYSKDVSDLVIPVNHTFADALSACYLARDVLEFLSDPSKKVEVLPSPPMINRESISSDAKDSFFVKKFIKFVNKRQDKNKLNFDYEDYENIFNAYWQRYNTKGFFIEFSSDETKKLIDFCRKENVTINSALLAFFIRSQSISKGVFKKQIGGVSVNLRDKISNSVDQMFGVYATGIYLYFKDRASMSFLDLVKFVHNTVEMKMSKKTYNVNLLRFCSMNPSVADRIVMKMYGWFVPKDYSRYDKLSSYSKKKDVISFMLKIDMPECFGFGMTNIGDLKFPHKYGDLEVDRCFFYPHTEPKTEFILSAVTTSGKLSLGVFYIEGVVNEKMANKIKNNINRLLSKELGLS